MLLVLSTPLTSSMSGESGAARIRSPNIDWALRSGLSHGQASCAISSGSHFVHEAEEKLKGLMLAGLAGDPAAHHELLASISQPLRAFLARRLANVDPNSAEDLLQDVLIAIHTRRGTYDPTQPVTAWIYAIARYKLIDHYRRHRRRGISVPIEDVAGLFSTDHAEASDAARDVEQLLNQLPEKQRLAIQSVKLQDMSVRDAAIQSGRSESDIKVSIHRGLKKLTALLAGRDKP
jgi:RNA polymerase sigma-70 factor (ECF subfamily)